MTGPSRWRTRVGSALLFAATCGCFLVLLQRGAAGEVSVVGALAGASARALLVCGAVWLVRRSNLIWLSLAFLALPYLLFFFGWLRLVYALPLGLLLLFGAIRVGRREADAVGLRPPASSGLSTDWLVAALVVFGWLVLSGAGGYGHQNVDYLMHNGRLNDLIALDWPVRYGPDQNLVFNLAYYLPSALLGKLFGAAIGFESVFFWTLFGLLIVVGWIFELLGRRSFLAILPFVAFGGLDWLGVQLLDVSDRWFVLKPEWPEWWWNDYVGSRNFIGGILSNTFSLFWSPHQVIAGWIVIASLTKLFYTGRKASLVFVYALCSFWSPLILIALLPFLAVALLDARLRDWREILSVENALLGPLVALVFGVFYLGGSALENPAAWIWQVTDLRAKWPSVLLFYALEFGVYAACAAPFVWRSGRREKLWFGTALAILVLLPLYRYGTFSDLACRGTTPALFVLMLAMVGSLGEAFRRGRRLAPLALVGLLAFGATTAIPELWMAVSRFGETQPAQSVPEYEWAFEQLGPDSSLFREFAARR